MNKPSAFSDQPSATEHSWRPISEIHEDCGMCVLMHLNSPGYLQLGSCLDGDFDETEWTHFAEVPKLTIEQASQLQKAMELKAESCRLTAAECIA